MKEFKIKVEVKLKSAVLDPQGKTVLTALKNLGYNQVIDTRIGKLIELKLIESNKDLAREKVEEMCIKLLSNPVIEEYSITVE
ncbi:MAG: phosphoribosylformylglycinamidine synthase subunit PurS [Thermodesulfobacteriota bacterium]|jgi:phosphoribosylformylglycinamidine synthase